MCHQSVGLVQSLVEAAGIPTVSVSMLPEVTLRVKPPRALLVPFPLGYPLGGPDDVALQQAVLTQALALLEVPASHPVMQSYQPEDHAARLDAGSIHT